MITPLGDRVVVEPLPVDDISAGGIIIPEKAKDRPNKGKVIAIAEDVKKIYVGDLVLYAPYAGTEMSIEGKQCVILRDTDCIAILSPTN